MTSRNKIESDKSSGANPSGCSGGRACACASCVWQRWPVIRLPFPPITASSSQEPHGKPGSSAWNGMRWAPTIRFRSQKPAASWLGHGGIFRDPRPKIRHIATHLGGVCRPGLARSADRRPARSGLPGMGCQPRGGLRPAGSESAPMSRPSNAICAAVFRSMASNRSRSTMKGVITTSC